MDAGPGGPPPPGLPLPIDDHFYILGIAGLFLVLIFSYYPEEILLPVINSSTSKRLNGIPPLVSSFDLRRLELFVIKNSCSTLRTFMKIKLSYFFILSVFMMLWSVAITAQSHSLPQPQMSDSTSGPVVVPPGLVVPIDENIYVLVIAGLGLGIYLLKSRKTS